MKLWLLKARPDVPGKNPFVPWYDKTFGLVVSAENEDTARQLAGADNEGFGWNSTDDVAAYLDPQWTSCEEIGIAHDSEERVFLVDFRRA